MEGLPPCYGSMAMGTPRGGSRPPGTTSCLSSRPHDVLTCTGRRWECLGAQRCRHAFHPLCASLPRPVVEGRRGPQEDTGHPPPPPVHRNVRAQAAGGTRDPDGERMSPGFRWPISHFQGCVCARGQRTLQVSLPRAPGSPCLTSIRGNQWGRRWGHWDPRVMVVKPGSVPELSWGVVWSAEVLGDPRTFDFLPGTFQKLTFWAETLLGH